MKKAAVAVVRAIMGAIYFFMKLMPTRDVITFISRQGNAPGIDFRMLADRLNADYPEYKTVMLCRMIPPGAAGKIGYVFHVLRQMRYIAVSRVVVLDTYCIPVSLLKHKKGLEVIQLWHALGAFKKFGWSVVGMPEGSPKATAELMRMHKGYTHAVTSGPACVPAFSEALATAPEKFLPVGIPRMDYLADEKYVSASRAAVLQRYPRLANGKKTILYVPTFRKGERMDYDVTDAVSAVLKAADLESFNLIVKTHSGQERIYADSPLNPDTGSEFMGMDMISVADYIISDYSSIVFEAGIAGKPMYLYCYDSDKYVTQRGFYLDYWRDIPAVISPDIAEIMRAIAEDRRVPKEDEERFIARYTCNTSGTVTEQLARIISELARGAYDGRYDYSPTPRQ